MSCGEPHEIDCRKVLDAVFLYLDNECDSSQQNLIRAHLDECSPCLREFGVEQEVKLLVARKCGGERAPDSLRVSLMARLRSVRAEAASGPAASDLYAE
ncbi:mycothiol system anti-sigma-R factor [Pseudofrankia sp. DC12]|uniref:mycothiol system anti-sigma-R factor n=1 Tax=Pseudofrankia sp. DC12 TaxID=683315 RepID=UPI0005F87F09|nr:mycothiol system anti-sigma-R factor [Pseudofrankia sp. DC12]